LLLDPAMSGAQDFSGSIDELYHPSSDLQIAPLAWFTTPANDLAAPTTLAAQAAVLPRLDRQAYRIGVMKVNAGKLAVFDFEQSCDNIGEGHGS